MARRRARTAVCMAVLVLLCLVMTACTGEDAADLFSFMSDLYSNVSGKTVVISNSEWYYIHRRSLSPDAWKGEAILDLGAPGFSLRDLSSIGLYSEPVVTQAGRHRVKSVTAMLDGDLDGLGILRLFEEPVQDDLAGYAYNALYPGIVPADLFVQAPVLPFGGSDRVLATAYAWIAGVEPCFRGILDYMDLEPDASILFRFTAIYSGTDAMACGFLLEYQSLDGMFTGCKYVYNIQPGISFDYATGRNWITAMGDPEEAAKLESDSE